MVINGLGFTQSPLYLTPHFFEDKPVERLIDPNIKAEQLNDTTLGRAMDSLFEHEISEIFAQISMKTVQELGLECRIGHHNAYISTIRILFRKLLNLHSKDNYYASRE